MSATKTKLTKDVGSVHPDFREGVADYSTKSLQMLAASLEANAASRDTDSWFHGRKKAVKAELKRRGRANA